ncbi:MAG: LemA family protein [Deferribacteraceae bacterium]|jgi:LemA protein|nr:LemA family protein [Deferribacteraceae bacterium]
MNTYLVAGIALVVVIVAIIAIYNSIIKNKNAIERAWAGVITQERQKNQILPAIEDVAEEYKTYEQGILKEIVSLRAGLSALSVDEIDINKVTQVESRMSAITDQLNVVVEAYPELKSAELMQNLMREISEQQENIGAAIQIFNRNVEIFNNGIETFPASIVNGILNREEKITPFYDSVAAAGFEYKPQF